jgi:hypothetical protein
MALIVGLTISMTGNLSLWNLKIPVVAAQWMEISLFVLSVIALWQIFAALTGNKKRPHL